MQPEIKYAFISLSEPGVIMVAAEVCCTAREIVILPQGVSHSVSLQFDSVAHRSDRQAVR